MGNILHREPDVNRDISSSRQGKRLNGGTSLYAEIVTDKTLPTDIPPIKVLIHDQIVSTATDSIRDSEVIVNQLSKALIVDFLHNPTSPEKFGTLLRYVLGYEYLVQPTRDLVYWSLRNKHIIKYVNSSCKLGTTNWVKDFSSHHISSNLRAWILGYGYPTVSELVCWSLKQEDVSVLPLTEIVTQSLPYAKENTMESLKATVTETLSSEDMKNYARSHIVGFISKAAGEVK